MAKKQIDVELRGKDSLSPVAKSAADKLKESLKGIKSGLGEESAIGGTLKALQGGGAVVGISIAGRLLSDAADRAGELKKQLDAGEISSGQMAEELAKSIPIFGGIIDAGRKWRSLLDGSAADIARINEESKLANGFVDTQLTALKSHREAYGKILETVQDIKDELALIGLEGIDKSITAIDQGLAKARRTAETEGKAAEETIKGRRAKQIADDKAAAEAALNRVRKARDAASDTDAAAGAGGAGDATAAVLKQQQDAQTELNAAKNEYAVIQSRINALREDEKSNLATEGKARADALIESEKLAEAQKAQIRKEAAAKEAAERDKIAKDEEAKAITRERRIADVRLKVRQEKLREGGDEASAKVLGFRAEQSRNTIDAFREAKDRIAAAPTLGGKLSAGLDFGREALVNKELADQQSNAAIKDAIKERLAGGIKGLVSGASDAADSLKGAFDRSVIGRSLRTFGRGLANATEGATGDERAKEVRSGGAQLMESRFLTGAGQRDEQLETQKSILKEQKKANELAVKLNDALQSNQLVRTLFGN